MFKMKLSAQSKSLFVVQLVLFGLSNVALGNQCSLQKPPILLQPEFESVYSNFQQNPLHCSGFAVSNEALRKNFDLIANCSAEEISKFFSVDRSITTLASLLDMLTPEKFKDIVFTRRFRESSIWSEQLLISAVNLVAQENHCGDYLDFFDSLNLDDNEETTMALYLLQGLPIPSAAKLQVVDWMKIERFFKTIVHVLGNERRVFSLGSFNFRTSAQLLFHSYRNKLLNSADTVYFSEDFRKSFGRFLPGTDPSIFDIVRPLDIIYMIESDATEQFSNLISDNPEFGFKIYKVLDDARLNSVSPYRESYLIRKFLENADYNILLSEFVDPNSFPMTFDRDPSSEQFLKSRWPVAKATNAERGLLFKRFFILNTIYNDKTFGALQNNYQVSQLMCVLTSQQFDYVLSSLRESVKLEWLDESARLPVNCIDELKAHKIVQMKSERFEVEIIVRTSYASKLENFGSLLPFVNWTVFIERDISSIASRSFLCSNKCKYCTLAQKTVLLEKAMESFGQPTSDECKMNDLNSHLTELLDVNTIRRYWQQPSAELKRWQKQKTLEQKRNQFLIDPEINLLRSPWKLSQERYSKTLYRLEPLLRSISSEDLDIQSKAILSLIKNEYCDTSHCFSLDYINVFGISLLPVAVLLTADPSQWPKNPAVCQEFIGKIGMSLEIDSELWIKRDLLVQHYLKYCSIFGTETASAADVILMQKLACGLSASQLKTMSRRAITENLSIFGKCCFADDQRESLKAALGPVASWQIHWFSLLGDLICDLVDNKSVNNLDTISGLPLAQILTNQRSCRHKHELILGYSEQFEQKNSYESCMKKVAQNVLDKLEVKHYMALGWRDEKCVGRNSNQSSLRTCAALMTLGKGLRYANEEEFAQLSDCEFQSCIHFFGKSQDLSREQSLYILKRIMSSGRNLYSREDILETLRLTPHRSLDSLSAILNSADLNLVNRLLSVKKWSPEKSKLIVAKYEALISGKWTKSHLAALTPDFICYLDMKNLQTEVVIEFIPVARSHVSACHGTDFHEQYFEKINKGGIVSSFYTAGDVQMLGNILRGMSHNDFSNIINYDNVHEVNPEVISSWNNESVDKLYTDFAQYLTPKQMKAVLLSGKQSKLNLANLLLQQNLNGFDLVRNSAENSQDIGHKDENQEIETLEDYILVQDTQNSVKLEIVYILAGAKGLQIPCSIFLLLLNVLL